RRHRCRDAQGLPRALSRGHSASSHRRRGGRCRRAVSRPGGAGRREPRRQRDRAGAGDALPRSVRSLAMLRLLSLTLFIATGVLASWPTADPMLRPPTAVAATIVAEARSGELFWQLGITLARVALAFSLAMAVGVAIGFLMGRVSLADRIGDPWLIVLLNLPAL